jgi:membrane protease YdiL (CAAX protease family)
VIPADPAQLFFLAGIVCLIFAPRMNWWPRYRGFPLSRLGLLDSPQSESDTYALSVLGTWLIIFSALAGYYLCFWPGVRPQRRVLFWVFLPAVLGICMFFGRFAYLGSSYSSLLDRSWLGSPFRAGQLESWAASPGFHVAFVGLLLIGIFTIRLIRGVSSLPLAFSEASVTELEVDLWRRTRFLVWVLVGPLFLAPVILGLGIGGIVLAFPKRLGAIVQNELFSYSTPVLEAVLILAIASWVIGTSGRRILRSSVQFFAPKYLFPGAAFPIGMAVLISSAHYLSARLQWATTHFGNTAVPQPGIYFKLPSPWLLLMFFAAFAEEVIFRGLLQTIFVRRHRLYRGIFLSGIVWAAYHFNGDAFRHPDEVKVVSTVAFRLALCLALGFVLSWLTLRAASVWPAAIAHALYNLLVLDFGQPFPAKSWVWVGGWAVLAFFVFRYWPVEKPGEMGTVIAATEPGIAP